MPATRPTPVPEAWARVPVRIAGRGRRDRRAVGPGALSWRRDGHRARAVVRRRGGGARRGRGRRAGLVGAAHGCRQRQDAGDLPGDPGGGQRLPGPPVQDDRHRGGDRGRRRRAHAAGLADRGGVRGGRGAVRPLGLHRHVRLHPRQRPRRPGGARGDRQGPRRRRARRGGHRPRVCRPRPARGDRHLPRVRPGRPARAGGPGLRCEPHRAVRPHRRRHLHQVRRRRRTW